jgi:hypothetical protein
MSAKKTRKSPGRRSEKEEIIAFIDAAGLLDAAYMMALQRPRKKATKKQKKDALRRMNLQPLSDLASKVMSGSPKKRKSADKKKSAGKRKTGGKRKSGGRKSAKGDYLMAMSVPQLKALALKLRAQEKTKKKIRAMKTKAGLVDYLRKSEFSLDELKAGKKMAKKSAGKKKKSGGRKKPAKKTPKKSARKTPKKSAGKRKSGGKKRSPGKKQKFVNALSAEEVQKIATRLNMRKGTTAALKKRMMTGNYSLEKLEAAKTGRCDLK